MKQNNNQKQSDCVFKREDAYQTLGMIHAWISNVDTKVSFALTLAGVLIGIILGEGFPNAFQRVTEVSRIAELGGTEIMEIIWVSLLYLCSFLSIISFIWAITARVKNPNNVSSIFFFGSIGSMDLAKYKENINQTTEERIVEDLEEQIHTNSRICSQKIKWYNRGTYFLISAIMIWFICTIFSLI